MPTISDEEYAQIQEALKTSIANEKLHKKFVESLGPAVLQVINPVLNALYEAIKQIAVNTKNIQVNVPEVKVPRTEVNIPEMKMPEISIPDVIVPEIRIPDIIVPEMKAPKVTVNIPKNDDILKGIDALKEVMEKPMEFPEQKEYTSENPMPVRILDVKGNPWVPVVSSGGSRQERRDGLILNEYDYVELSTTEDTDIYVFKSGGSTGKSVNTVRIVYIDGTRNTISSVTKS